MSAQPDKKSLFVKSENATALVLTGLLFVTTAWLLIAAMVDTEGYWFSETSIAFFIIADGFYLIYYILVRALFTGIAKLQNRRAGPRAGPRAGIVRRNLLIQLIIGPTFLLVSGEIHMADVLLKFVLTNSPHRDTPVFGSFIPALICLHIVMFSFICNDVARLYKAEIQLSREEILANLIIFLCCIGFLYGILLS